MKGKMGSLNKLVRRSFFVYQFLRKFAPVICEHFLLEDGFEVLESIDSNFARDKVLVDIGSNDGTSIAMMRQYFPDHPIYSFEPLLETPNRYRTLESRGLLVWNKVAIGSEPGFITIFTPIIRGKPFYQFSSTNQTWINENVAKYLDFRIDKFEFRSQVVPIKTLDSFQIQPFFIKIDVEGGELKVLEGARETIGKWSPIILLEINNERSFAEICAFMNSISYRSQSNSIFRPEINNYVFIPINDDSFSNLVS